MLNDILFFKITKNIAIQLFIENLIQWKMKAVMDCRSSFAFFLLEKYLNQQITRRYYKR